MFSTAQETAERVVTVAGGFIDSKCTSTFCFLFWFVGSVQLSKNQAYRERTGTCILHPPGPSPGYLGKPNVRNSTVHGTASLSPKYSLLMLIRMLTSIAVGDAYVAVGAPQEQVPSLP